MTKEEYLETLNIKGYEVKIGIDDYGQCYFCEWIDDNGELQTHTCGTYNINYLEDIYSIFDRKGVYISLYGEEEYNNYIASYVKNYSYRRSKYDPKEDAELIKHHDEVFKLKMKEFVSEDYGLYDFKKMYEERINQC